MAYTLKQKIGALIYDLPRFIWSMRPFPEHDKRAAPWIFMRNRNEHLLKSAKNKGVKCEWKWTSDLHIAKVFPSLGRSLMKKALKDWPIRLENSPAHAAGQVDVSFVIGHRGAERLPHLLLTLRTIAAQRNVSIECIVVEQSHEPEIKNTLPAWVHYIHTPLPYPDMPYCRSWAFNVGALNAQGKVLILHDNDMLMPQDYALQVIDRYREGNEVMNLKRFIFYFSNSNSERIFSSKNLLLDEAPDTTVQNLEAGGSVAISKEAYFAIGGFDESFIGWGGEDNEFWERAQTLKVWPFGYLPLVHLWHKSQPEKFTKTRESAELFKLKSALTLEQRIREMSANLAQKAKN